MGFLDITPILSVFSGILLFGFILLRRSGLGKNKRIKYVLCSLIFLYTFVSFDYFLIINNQGDTPYFGISYMFFHLAGFLFYYFIALFVKAEINFKKWLLIVIGLTLARFAFYFPFLKYRSLSEFLKFVHDSNYLALLNGEYYLVNLINIALIVLAYSKLRKTPTILELNQRQAIQYKWVKFTMICFIALQVGVFLNDVVSEFNLDTYQAYLKFDTFMITVFFFLFTFSIMQFPIFVYTGDFDDLPNQTREKYTHSSLSDSSELFEEIKDLVERDQLYRDYDLKLNTLAESLHKSIHHISQAINQNAKMSFPDFINSYRIEEAKARLRMPKPDTIFAIYLDVGFNSKTAFYSAFKKFTLQTPSEFKKAHGS